MTTLNDVARLVERVATGRRRLIGMSLVRIGLGSTSVLIYVSNLRMRDMVYGPHGEAGLADFVAAQHESGSVFSLYSLSGSEWWFNLVYFTGLASAAVWTVFGGRPLAAVNLVFIWSLQERNLMITDAGDNIQRIIVLFLVFSTTNAHFSPVANRVRTKIMRSINRPTMVNCLHNIAGTLIVFQACVVYVVAGLWKIVDLRWREGDALYYISQVNEFQYLSVFPRLMHMAAAVTVIGYATILVQLSVPVAAVTRRRWLREAILLIVVGMHLGIMFGMGLVGFGLIMISADATVIRDADYLAVAAAIRLRVRVARQKPQSKHATSDGTPCGDVEMLHKPR